MKYFTQEHEWISIDGSIATVGITDHAQKSLGDVVYLELPEPGKKLEQGKIFGVVESVKAVSDLYSPVSGEVMKTHAELVQNPEWVNQSAEDKAWMLQVSLSNPEELGQLMTREDYEKYLREEVK